MAHPHGEAEGLPSSRYNQYYEQNRACHNKIRLVILSGAKNLTCGDETTLDVRFFAPLRMTIYYRSSMQNDNSLPVFYHAKELAIACKSALLVDTVAIM